MENFYQRVIICKYTLKDNYFPLKILFLYLFGDKTVKKEDICLENVGCRRIGPILEVWDVLDPVSAETTCNKQWNTEGVT